METFIDVAVRELVIKRLEQTPAFVQMWDFIWHNNPGNLNGYHNNLHQYRMAGIALDLYRSTPEYADLPRWAANRNELMLLTACLWHDYGHSGGKLSDDQNIEVATQAFRHYWGQHRNQLIPVMYGSEQISKPKMLSIGGNYKRTIIDIISVTQWPFVKDPANTMQQCIRDADLLYTYGADTGEVVYSLFLELKIAGKIPEDWTFKDFMGRQAVFISECVFFTDKGKQLHHELSPGVLQAQYDWGVKQGHIQ